jgi:hypothetical protein|tara:strand:- start:1312 stop:1533 length:222 start_codon:yes stop_codon:yes gene_type:complete
MRYQLKNKSTHEVISVVDDGKFGVDEAKNYFVRVKQLDEKDFDELFTVDKVDIGTPRLDYKWWNEESKKLDDF